MRTLQEQSNAIPNRSVAPSQNGSGTVARSFIHDDRELHACSIDFSRRKLRASERARSLARQLRKQFRSLPSLL